MRSATVTAIPTPPAVSGPTGLTRFAFVRTVLALLAVCVPVALVLVPAAQIADKSLRMHWPPLLAALLGLAGYFRYVRRIERRVPAELVVAGWPREALAGALIGTLLFLVALGLAAAIGDYHFLGTGSWDRLAKTVTEMIFVATIEEVLFRGVLFRIPERSLGSWWALLLSAVIFALAHVPNHDVTVLAVVNTALAGVLFAAAYLATRRLWLPIGMHFAWNLIPAGILSLPNSGNPGRGLLQGELSGPQWITGGAYGIEGSVITLVLFGVASLWLLRRAMRAGHLVARPRAAKAPA